MRPRLLAALAVGALTVSLLGPTDARAVDPSGPAPSPATAHASAAAVLAEAQAVFETGGTQRVVPSGRRDATLVLNQLMRVRDDLTPTERRQADRLFARPTDGNSDAFGDGYRVRQAKPVCGGVICVHYVRRTGDAPPRADSDGDRIPNAVEQTLRITRHVHDTYVHSGYRRPDSDGKRGGRRGKVDIYLANTGGAGIYGYCTTDQGGRTYNRWAYCVIDDDFSEFVRPGTTAQENREVTLAHEYYHAVQFAYDFFEDPWFMEATAAWVEDEVYDDVDDNYQYLPDGQLGSPRVPLDRFRDPVAPSNHYGNWIWFRYLTERWPQSTGALPRIVLDAWRSASGRRGAPDLYSTQAINAALVARGTGFASTYADFAAANRTPASSYAEGTAYEDSAPFDVPADPVRTHTVSQSTVQGAVTVDHLTSATVAFEPGADLTETGWTLRVRADLPPNAAQSARAVVHHADGTVDTEPLQSEGTGPATATLPFAAGEVRNVELVVVNASRQMRCWRDQPFACSGVPLENGLVTDYTATPVPPA